MGRAILLLTVMGFLAALLPAALWAQDGGGKGAFLSQTQVSSGRPAADVSSPKSFRPSYARPGNRLGYDEKPWPPLAGNWPAKPGYGFPDRPSLGFRPPYQRPPQWSLDINNGRGNLSYNRYDRYDRYPPYYDYDVYREDYYPGGENRRNQYFSSKAAPEEPRHFQGGGGSFERFERRDEEAAAPPSYPNEDNSRMDLETYHLMMKAWQ